MKHAAITGDKVELRPWEPAEAELYVAMRDAVVFRFTTESEGLDADVCRGNIEATSADPNRASFAICSPSGNPVGNIEAIRSASMATISYWLASEARGQGWAADALRAVSAWSTETWDLEYLELEIDPENEASIRVARSAGYRRHGWRLESSCGGPALTFRLTGNPPFPRSGDH